MNKRIINIGFSPCPNDTFIFEAMVNGKIDTGSFRFEPVLEDVQTLNEWAMQNKLPVTKLSYGVLPLVTGAYELLSSGSALGRGAGPLLISDGKFNSAVEDATIAIPGAHTTAHFLFSNAYPQAKHKVFMRYDEIESFVQSGKGLGVIIHENRFTYQQKGLQLIQDLGVVWENTTGLPIPLGGIVIRKSMPIEIKRAVNDCIRRSIAYAYAQMPEISEMVRAHAQEMEEDVMRAHISLYVNAFTENLGEQGIQAVRAFEKIAQQHQPGDTQPVTIIQ
ncbi:MAG TPA: 1,4-dihydroxy-6-naphthoate synthase [Ferruginibacter sp.]|nr:1,4-dihydroxy-6-naphthoate synthase [Ferruginibacter sp.]HRP50622.1 1,4-dihydroxy-6-naphthoate synthase [Ferruginibacter sp.]